jgi:hypothetical protein
MREGLDAYLFTDKDGWLPAREAILYLEMEVGILFDSITLRKLGIRHKLMRKSTKGWFFEYEMEKLKSKVIELYLSDPPKGFISIYSLRKKYPFVEIFLIRQWILKDKIPTIMKAVGTMEVLYVKESVYRELYRERTSKRQYSGMPGAEKWSCKGRKIGKKGGKHKNKNRK